MRVNSHFCQLGGLKFKNCTKLRWSSETPVKKYQFVHSLIYCSKSRQCESKVTAFLFTGIPMWAQAVPLMCAHAKDK